MNVMFLHCYVLEMKTLIAMVSFMHYVLSRIKMMCLFGHSVGDVSICVNIND